MDSIPKPPPRKQDPGEKRDRLEEKAKRLRSKLKRKDRERKRLIAAGVALNYRPKDIAEALGMNLGDLEHNYGDLLAAGRRAQAMKVTAHMLDMAATGDARAALELMRMMERELFSPPKQDLPPQVPVTFNLSYSPAQALPAPTGQVIDGQSLARTPAAVSLNLGFDG